jgi:quercetin dioxygenase-like cupin family protein
MPREERPVRALESSLWRTAICALLIHATAAVAADAHVSGPVTSATSQRIKRAGTQPSVLGPADYFTGRVRVDPLWPAGDDIPAAGGLVTFEPGARSAWHTHPKGQQLLVVSGVGLTQEWGKRVQEIRPGDVVWCPPGVKHWHGASPTTAMTHLAVSGTADGKNVEWLEKVSDEQYKAR